MRVAFVVDGFNVYHSIKAAERKIGQRLRWLDLDGLCRTLLSSVFGHGHTCAGVYYYSALANHLTPRNPGVVQRHRNYIDALKATGVSVTTAKFKKKDREEALRYCRVRFGRSKRCWRFPIPGVRISMRTHEEKETDVAIAAKLFELLCTGAADAVVLIIGDTDVAPAIRTAKSIFPNALVCVGLPYDRHNRELERVASRSFKIGPQLYSSSQLPDPVLCGKSVLNCPKRWK